MYCQEQDAEECKSLDTLPFDSILLLTGMYQANARLMGSSCFSIVHGWAKVLAVVVFSQYLYMYNFDQILMAFHTNAFQLFL